MRTETKEPEVPKGLLLGKNKVMENGRMVRIVVKKVVRFLEKRGGETEVFYRVIRYEREKENKQKESDGQA